MYYLKLKHEERYNTSYFNAINKNEQRSKNEWIHIPNIDNILSEIQFHDDEPIENWHKLQVLSPIQTNLIGMTRTNKCLNVKVTRPSLNTVLLDDNPSMKCSSLLVAHNVNIDVDEGLCKLAITTLFPKIKGIVSKCLLAFAPQVELR